MWYLLLRRAIPCPTPRSGSSLAQPQGLTSVLDRALQVLDLLVGKRRLVGFRNPGAGDVLADDRPFVRAAGTGDLEEAAEFADPGVGIPALPELLVVDREDRDRPAGDGLDVDVYVRVEEPAGRGDDRLEVDGPLAQGDPLD